MSIPVNCLKEYRKSALKLAEVKFLGRGEGFSARIPGFHGLIVFGATKSEVMAELESVLEGWIEVALARGNGLPSLHPHEEEVAIAH